MPVPVPVADPVASGPFNTVSVGTVPPGPAVGPPGSRLAAVSLVGGITAPGAVGGTGVVPTAVDVVGVDVTGPVGAGAVDIDGC